MDAQQCVKLTGTNRSIGLILYPPGAARSGKPAQDTSPPQGSDVTHTTRSGSTVVRLDDLVVMARGPTPDPIPNSAVKTLSANGTASQDVGE